MVVVSIGIPVAILVFVVLIYRNTRPKLHQHFITANGAGSKKC
jgi:hypothetical protein